MTAEGRRGGSGPDGIVLVDKAGGWTSHDVVARARRLLGTRRVGHSGTLDPDATGLLVLGVGRATRLLTFLTGLDKAYTGTAVMGTATSTLDASGEVTGTWDMSGVGVEEVRKAAAGLTGPIRQVPPMVSAKKVGGRRLHELAREGREVAREPVDVEIHRFEVGDPPSGPGPGVPAGPGAGPALPIEVRCSSGTYIRSLVDDLGRALGGGAHLRDLRRVTVGSFGVGGAVPVEELAPDRVRPPVAAFPDRPVVTVTGDVARAVGHGQVLPATRLGAGAGGGPWPVVDDGGRLLAVYVTHRAGSVKPAVVLS